MTWWTGWGHGHSQLLDNYLLESLIAANWFRTIKLQSKPHFETRRLSSVDEGGAVALDIRTDLQPAKQLGRGKVRQPLWYACVLSIREQTQWCSKIDIFISLVHEKFALKMPLYFLPNLWVEIKMTEAFSFSYLTHAIFLSLVKKHLQDTCRLRWKDWLAMVIATGIIYQLVSLITMRLTISYVSLHILANSHTK